MEYYFPDYEMEPGSENEGFFLFKKKEGGRQSSCGAGSMGCPELAAKFLGEKKNLELSPYGNVYTGFTQLVENCAADKLLASK